jgi:hypothetical protein
MGLTVPRPVFATLRALLGGFEVTSPRLAAQLARLPTVRSPVLAVIRVLGARQLGQALVTLVRPTSALLVAGAAVDGLHAASMVALGSRRPWRRAALIEATFGLCLAAGGARAAWVARRRPGPSILGARAGASSG